MFDFLSTTPSTPPAPGRRARLRAWASSRLFIVGAHLSPDEAVRFAAHVREQTHPEPTTTELITAFLNGGIPAVISQLS